MPTRLPYHLAHALQPINFRLPYCKYSEFGKKTDRVHQITPSAVLAEYNLPTPAKDIISSDSSFSVIYFYFAFPAPLRCANTHSSLLLHIRITQIPTAHLRSFQ
jgi:hypothetical protein